MTDQNHTPPGWPAVVPRISVGDPEKMVDFIKEVFGAKGEYQKDRPTELRIGNSLVMVGDVLIRTPSQSFLYVYVPDVDESHKRALELGAQSIESPEEMAYGDRRSMIEDNWGNRWQIATHRGFKDDL